VLYILYLPAGMQVVVSTICFIILSHFSFEFVLEMTYNL
jgi:hypothetical protein